MVTTTFGGETLAALPGPAALPLGRIAAAGSC